MSEKILGHHSQQEFLQTLWTSGRLPHALLFTGPEGIGKRQVAEQLAGQILGDLPLKNHPDFILLEPEEGRLKIGMIRELKHTLAFPPLKGHVRVVLMDDAHTLNAAAANALLKVLEEPPPGTHILLVTHAPGWLPRTIVSRCQNIRFSPLQNSDLEKILASEAVRLPEGMIPWAQGSPRRARQLARVMDSLPSLRALLPSRDALTYSAAYALAAGVVEGGHLEAFLNGLLSATHHVLTHPRKNDKYDFDLLVFAQRILEMSAGLRQNIQPKMHLNHLLLFFQQPKEIRYAD